MITIDKEHDRLVYRRDGAYLWTVWPNPQPGLFDANTDPEHHPETLAAVTRMALGHRNVAQAPLPYLIETWQKLLR